MSMNSHSKDDCTPAEKAGATAQIVGSLNHEGYVPNTEDEAINQQALQGDITSEQVIAIFCGRGLEREQKALTDLVRFSDSSWAMAS